MARKFRITVNGKTYEVDVEEFGGSSVASPSVTQAVAPAPAPAQAPVQVQEAAPAAPAPQATPEPAPAPAPASAGAIPEGATTIGAPMPGKILKVGVQMGQKVNEGDMLLVLEAMKMENEIYAPVSGTVVQISCKEGDNVNTNDPLVTIA